MARLGNSRKQEAKLDKLYEDVEPILRERDQNKTGHAIFKKLHQMNAAKYPEKARRTTVRHVDDLLSRLYPPKSKKEIDAMWAKIACKRQ